MAIYSLNLGFISRSEGRSAVGFSAYISGGKSQDIRTGVSYDYGCKNDVIVNRILAPGGAPEWAKTSSTLWNTVEQFEDHIATLRFRADSHDPDKKAKSLSAKEQFLNCAQTAQTIMGALPIEFTQLEAEACVEEFLKERFISRGLVVEYAIHWDKGNPHFHGLITRRPLVNDSLSADPLSKSPLSKDSLLKGSLSEGFSQRKDRDIVSKAELFVTRKQWEVVANKYLCLAGYEVRIDSRSYADQGLSFLPTHHEGWYAQRLAERGQYSRIVADNEAIRQKNIEILCDRPEILIHEVSLKRTVFTRQHVEEEIIRRVGGDEKLFTILKAKVEGLAIPPEIILKQANDNQIIDRNLTMEGGSDIRKLASHFADQLLSNEKISYRVGENINRDPVFTSASYKKQEDQILSFGDILHKSQSKSVSDDLITKSVQNREEELGFVLSDEQRTAITHLCTGSDLRILNGKAGTGKTTLLKAVAEAYQEAEYRVLGTSFQGKAVEIMEQEIGISCKTLDSFKVAWDKYQQHKDLIESEKLWGRPYEYAVKAMKDLEIHQLTSKDIIIVDEANMIGNNLWEVFLKQASEKRAKVLLVQDPAQIKSREPGDTGRLFAERYGYCETTEVVRQRIPWQRDCSRALNDHHVLDGLKLYYEKGHIHWFEDRDQTFKKLTQEYVKDVIENPHQTRIALAYRNADVYEINQSIREALKAQGYFGKNKQDHQDDSYHRPPQELLQERPLQEFRIDGENYAIGDRVRFTQNDYYGRYVKNLPDTSPHFLKEKLRPNGPIGVKNGTFGVIEAFDETQSLVTVRLEGNRRVQFNSQDYNHLTLGYAISVHKSEGSTFDKCFVALDPLMDPSTLLVSMTRHRQDVQVFVNRDQFIDFKDVVNQLGSPSLSQTVQDYHVPDEQKPYFKRVQQYRDLIIETSTLREEIEGELEVTRPFYKHPSYSAYQACLREKKQIAGEILNDWQNYAPYVRLAGIRKDILETEVGLRPRLLSDLEYRASIQVQEYMDLVRETRSLWKTISESKTESTTPTNPGVLAHSHPLYEDYQSHKADRDSLAAVIQENPKLYQPFFKVTKSSPLPLAGDDSQASLKELTSRDYQDYWGEKIEKGDRIYFTAVKVHAAAHHKSQLQNLFYERLNPEQKDYYNELKAYVKARNESAAIYSHLKKQDHNSVPIASMGLRNTLEVDPGTALQGFTLDSFHTHQAQRDTLALKLVESPEKYKEFFTLLNIKEDKLLEHAVAGELRQKIQCYTQEQDTAKRTSQAQELKRILTTSNDFRIFNETTRGIDEIDLNRLTFDIAFYENIRNGNVKNTLHPDQVYKPIQSYLNSSKEAAKLWKTVQTKGQANPNHKKDWEVAFQARNDNAKILLGNKVAFSILTGMDQRLKQQAYRHADAVQSFIHDPSEKNTPDQSFSLDGNVKKNPQPFFPVSQVLEASRGHTAAIAIDLLGNPNKHLSSQTTLRFGNKGSLVINLSGPKAGLWKDFESGEGGNLIQLVQREKNMSFKDAVSYLANTLNINSLTEIPFKKDSVKDKVAQRNIPTAFLTSPSKTQKTPNSLEEDKETAKDIASRLNAVSELQMKSKLITGTLAETYLREERGIKGLLADDLRYLPKETTFIYQGERKTLSYPCLAAFGRALNGRLSSVQLTKLTEEGKRALAPDGQKLAKIHYGIAKGSFVCLQEDKTVCRVFIAEGIETALSIKDAGVKGIIVASLGINNIPNYQGSEKEVILCGDNDDHKHNTQT